MNYSRSLSRIFLWPLVIGIASAIGLVSALFGDETGDGIHDALSWLLLSIPIIVALYYTRPR